MSATLSHILRTRLRVIAADATQRSYDVPQIARPATVHHIECRINSVQPTGAPYSQSAFRGEQGMVPGPTWAGKSFEMILFPPSTSPPCMTYVHLLAWEISDLDMTPSFVSRDLDVIPRLLLAALSCCY